MASADPASGVVVRVPLPEGLERIRRHEDVVASVGAPPHITLLFPFMPLARLRPSVRAALAEIAATVEPFEVRFARVGHFPGVLYLVPEPAAPFERLTAAITARFPDYQPYEGAFDEVIAHLTIVESPKAPLDVIEAAVVRHLPFVRRVSALEVLVDDQDGTWRVHWRIALGRRRPRRRGPG